MKRLFYFVVLILLLFMPMVASFAFIHGPADLLLRDILFVEGVMLLVLGAQSGEYIWNYVRKWTKMRRERCCSTELLVGLALLTVGVIYVLVALLFPAGTFL